MAVVKREPRSSSGLVPLDDWNEPPWTFDDEDDDGTDGRSDLRSDAGPFTRRRVSNGGNAGYARSVASGGGGSVVSGMSASQPPDIRDWAPISALLSRLGRGAVIRVSDWPNPTGRSDDTWAPGGACEQTVVEMGLVKVRKRQIEDKCRVIGCPAGAAVRSPFMCDYHCEIGVVYVVVALAAGWTANMKLCNRCHRWEWLRNFARRSGKYNLTCRACCSKANYRNRKPGDGSSVQVSIDGVVIGAVDAPPEATLAECRDKYIPEATGKSLRSLRFFVRGSPLGPDQEGMVRLRECIDSGGDTPTLALVWWAGDQSSVGTGGAGGRSVADYRTGSPASIDQESDSPQSLHKGVELDAQSVTASHYSDASAPGTGAGRLVAVELRDAPSARLWYSSANCEQVLFKQGVLRTAATTVPSSHCRVRGCSRTLNRGPSSYCDYHTDGLLYVAKLDRDRVFVVYDHQNHRLTWLGARLLDTATPHSEGDHAAPASVAAGSISAAPPAPHHSHHHHHIEEDSVDAEAGGVSRAALLEASQSPLRGIAQSLLRTLQNFMSSLGVVYERFPDLPTEDSAGPEAFSTFCVNMLACMKELNSFPEVRDYLESVHPGRGIWEECVGEAGFTLQQLAAAVGCRRVVKDLGYMDNMADMLGTIEEDVDMEDGAAAVAKFVRAASWGNEGMVTKMLESGIPVDAAGAASYTALMAASRCGYPRVVSLLLSHGAKPNLAARDGQTPLIMAARSGAFEVVQRLVEAGADVEQPDMFGYTALMRAARVGHAHIVKFLAAHGASVNRMCTFNGYTALLWAATKGHMQVARELLNAGANVYLANVFGETALSVSKYKRHSGMIALLTKAARGVTPATMPSVPVSSLAAVAASLQDGMVEFVSRLGVEPPERVAVPEFAETTPLAYHEFCQGMLRVMKALNVMPKIRAHLDSISSSSNVWDQVVSAEGVSLLHFAAEVGCMAVVKELRENGAVQYMLDGERRLANNASEVRLLRYASQNNVSGAIRLLEQGVDVNCRVGTEGYTPLMAAARCGQVDMARLLLNDGASVNMSSAHGQTPLILAATNAYIGVVDLLITSGADVNAMDLYGPALVRAARYGHLDVVEYLLNHGANVNGAGRYNGITALMWAATRGDLPMTKLLVERGADLHSVSMFAETAKDCARRGHYFDVVRYLQSMAGSVAEPTPIPFMSDPDAADAPSMAAGGPGGPAPHPAHVLTADGTRLIFDPNMVPNISPYRDDTPPLGTPLDFDAMFHSGNPEDFML